MPVQQELPGAHTVERTVRKASQPCSARPSVAPADSTLTPTPPLLAYLDNERGIRLFHGDCFDLFDRFNEKYPDGIFDTVFADPPYFLSNGGSTCQGGERVVVDKGQWDKSGGFRKDFKFTLSWLRKCQRSLKPGGTLWVTGTHHSIFVVGYALQRLGFHILNDIAWEKSNPPPNLACRSFTHSTETLIWAARSGDADHIFNYDLMRRVNRGAQMQTVWRLNAPGAEEKSWGDHPTQKPVSLVTRCLLASTCEGDLVFDPFLGSGTTAVACLRNRRRFVGIDAQSDYVNLAIERVKAEVRNGDDLFAPQLEIQPALLL
jgi:site-specific DNA-methyltransferase (adenine-specific)